MTLRPFFVSAKILRGPSKAGARCLGENLLAQLSSARTSVDGERQRNRALPKHGLASTDPATNPAARARACACPATLQNHLFHGDAFAEWRCGRPRPIPPRLKLSMRSELTPARHTLIGAIDGRRCALTLGASAAVDHMCDYCAGW